MMNESDISVPEEMKKMLLDYTVSVLLTKPKDLLVFTADYFNHLLEERSKAPSTSLTLSEKKPNRRKSSAYEQYVDVTETPENLEVIIKGELERDRIKKIFKNNWFLKDLDDAESSLVIDELIPRRTTVKETIIVMGDTGDYFYIVDYGRFEAYSTPDCQKDSLLRKYDNSGYFGELALLHDAPRDATVRSATTGFLWALSKKAFQSTILQDMLEKRKQLVPMLKNVPALMELSDYDIKLMCDTLQVRTFGSNQIVIYKGDMWKGIFFVDEGELISSVIDDDGTEDNMHIRSGQYFGGVAERSRAPTTIKTLTPAKLAFFNFQAIQEFFGSETQLLHRNMVTWRHRSLASIAVPQK